MRLKCPMRLKFVAATLAAATALAYLAAPAFAQSNRNGNTVFTTRGEDGRTRTRIIIQKRSYLDPGTEVLPGSRNDQGYAFSPNQRPTSVLDNTVFGGNQSALPDGFSLLGKNGPFLRF